MLTLLSPLPALADGIPQLIRQIAAAENVDPGLVEAVVAIESAFNPKSVSKSGAQGLMQLMPFTAKEMGVDDPFVPEQNIRGGTRYLKKLLERFQGSVSLALAAYNAGAAHVIKHEGIPPFPQTQRYVVKVLAYYYDYQQRHGEGAPSFDLAKLRRADDASDASQDAEHATDDELARALLASLRKTEPTEADMQPAAPTSPPTQSKPKPRKLVFTTQASPPAPPTAPLRTMRTSSGLLLTNVAPNAQATRAPIVLDTGAMGFAHESDEDDAQERVLPHRQRARHSLAMGFEGQTSADARPGVQAYRAALQSPAQGFEAQEESAWDDDTSHSSDVIRLIATELPARSQLNEDETVLGFAE
ncbi:lytic transglycosylase domain-containing protein [Magnetofaba australis]|uniref:Putative lytic transglycosylase, catalytic n=1 Tax=Magnetofaba australis IT-1 TaxID=1434232 RepID=A0A1Y2K6C4_9PROT|nr:lytic transglycosylase domain-containing protein [Magnetofaba australis]OSM02575.1 putative lytic transglycosylase, catalytic [Magnetofaba australis IT-1]